MQNIFDEMQVFDVTVDKLSEEENAKMNVKIRFYHTVQFSEYLKEQALLETTQEADEADE